MRKTLAEIYQDAWMQNNSPERDSHMLHRISIKAVASAVRKRVKRKLAADARCNEMEKSEWVLR